VTSTRVKTGLWRAVITLCGLLVGRQALAAPVVLDFDGLAHRTTVIAQFAGKGITFNAPQVLDFTALGLPLPQPFARSGTKGIEQCFATEFCTAPIEMQFTAPQRFVKAWVGASFPVVVPFTVVLTGFDAQGAQAAQASIEIGSALAAQPITRPLEAVAPAQSIVRATIAAIVGAEVSATNGMAIDDIEFDTEGPPPVCNAADRAFVGLIEPKEGARTQVGSFLLQGLVVTDALLEGAHLTLTGPDGVSSTGDLLSSGMIQRAGGPFGPTRCSPLKPGANRIGVTVTNCKGSDTEERTVFYDPIPQGTAFVLKNIQFMQAIQDTANHVPLIAGKPTVARVYLELSAPAGTIASVFDVRGVMTAAHSNGTPLPGPLSIASINRVTVSKPMPVTAQFKLDETLNFELPPEWIAEGTIHARVSRLTVESAILPIDCLGCSTPFVFGVARFEAAPAVRLVLFDVPWTSQNVTHTTAATHFDHLESWLRRVYPTGDLQVSRSQLAAFSGLPATSFDCDDVNARLFQALNLGSFDPRVHFYGLVDDNGSLVSGKGFMRGCSRGIPGRVASGPAGTSSWGWDNDGSYADWYGGHELAHTYGRKHPGFCDGNSDDDDDFPYSGGRIGNVHSGFDSGDAALTIPRAVLSPVTNADLMTYCDFQWISDYTYLGILSRLRAIEGSGGGGGRVSEALMIQGRIDLVTNAVTLRPFLRATDLAETGVAAESRFAVELRSQAGAVLALHPFEVAEDSEPEPGRNLFGSFDLIVPWVNGTQAIVILEDGQELTRRTVSRSTPQVAVEPPSAVPGRGFVGVRWSGIDADRDELTYTLQYTPDDGSTWTPIATGLTETEFAVPLAQLPGGRQARFRVLATDGVNTGVGVQEQAFVVPQKRPRARILRPESGAQFPAGAPVILQGDAYDVEDGHLREASLRWTSPAGVEVGTGTAISLDGLSPGTHRFTLTAEDSEGATGSDAVDVEVLAAPIAAQADVDSPVGVGTTVTLDGSGSAGHGALTYAWSLVSKPAGSASAVLEPQKAVTKITVDQVGFYGLQLAVADSAGQAAVALPTIQAIAAVLFKRGEATGDGALDISDAARILSWLFLGGEEPGCIKAADANNDESVDLSDATLVLSFLFLGGRALEAPFPSCGIDPTSDELGCKRSNCQ